MGELVLNPWSVAKIYIVLSLLNEAKHSPGLSDAGHPMGRMDIETKMSADSECSETDGIPSVGKWGLSTVHGEVSWGQ